MGNSPEDDSQSDVPSVDDGPSVGETLRKARIEAGLSIEAVSAATRVRAPIVQGIEQDDYSRCGGDVYARGHIRTLARAAGIDPKPLIERFDAERGGAPAPTPATPLFEAERIRRAEPRRPNWTAAMVAAIVVVIGFVGFTLANGNDDKGGHEAAEGSTPQTSKPVTKPGHDKPGGTRPTPTESAIAAAPRDKVTVVVEAADGRSWIAARDHNGRTLFDGMLKQGQTKTFQDKEKIGLILGDAGAIDLVVNGKPVDDEFRPGQVERLSYTKGDPAAG
ncbi:helix-turn-helix domain-containing protein [Streptomyces sp. NA04227]|uniref:helix-turn-helix domain-containing protein n=1 Tax=Streptomyces sp. NA04227 TaxID=2742136 RepID=UPI0020CA8EE5|nr:helix-turn-helix domain-containing protein [Streptomyces sp. NA04227]